MIVDTSFIIDLIRGDDAAIEKAKELEEENGVLKLSAATVFELYTGVARSDKPSDEKEKVLRTIGSKQVVEADHRTMEKGGRIHGNLINKGQRVGAFDCIIAATAQLQEEELLTGNEEDFERIPMLDIRTY